MGIVFREKALNGYREHQTPLLIRNALDSFLHCDNLYNLGHFQLVSPDIQLDYGRITELQTMFRKDVIKDKYGYQYFQFFIAGTKSYFSFLHTPCIQNLEKTKYHVNSPEELYVYLEEFLKVIKENRIRYSEVFVSVFIPEHQQLFYEFGFRARGYMPCWNYKKEVKAFEDYVELEIISPNKIGEILGVKGETIARFAKDEYGLSIPKTGGEYQSIQHSLRNLRVDSEYYDDYFHYTDFLGGLKRGSKGLFGDFPFIFNDYYDAELIKELTDKGIITEKDKVIAAFRSRETQVVKSRDIWLTEKDYSHILDRHPKHFEIFGIPYDIKAPEAIGNLILQAIAKYPIVQIEEGRALGAFIYIYKIRRPAGEGYLHVLVDPDGHIVTAYTTKTLPTRSY